MRRRWVTGSVLRKKGPLLTLCSIADRKDLDHKLNVEVDAAIQKAFGSLGQGVLVTRHDRETFTIELSADVPHGTILELDLCARR